MRNLFTLLIILWCFAVKGQPGILSPDPHAIKSAPVVLYIDFIKMDLTNNYLRCIEPMEIANINVYKDSTYKGGAIFITLKDPGILKKLIQDKQLSLSDVVKTHVPAAELDKPVIYILNKQLLTDTAGIRMPASRVYTVTVTRSAETAYFKTTFPGAIIIEIYTTPPVMYIRGGAIYDESVSGKLKKLNGDN